MPSKRLDFPGKITVYKVQNSPSRQIYLLGALRVYQDGGVVSLSGEKVIILLAYLVLNPHLPHQREKLADMLYTDAPYARVRRNFSDTLYRLQRVLSRDWFVVEGDTVALAVDDRLWVDVWEFEQLANSDQENNLKKAIDLYTGDLLPELYEDWLVPERELRRNQYLTTLERLAAAQEGRGELQLALQTLRRLVLAEPLHEPAHQAYLRVLGRLQRFGEALAHYEYLRKLIWSELGAEPLSQTVAIADAIAKERELATIQIVGEDSIPFVGRNEERAAILSAVENMLKGHGSIFVIEGEPGIGKTRLLSEIVASVRWRGASLLQGQATETPSVSPFSPLIEALAPFIHGPRAGQLDLLLTDEARIALAPINPAWKKNTLFDDSPEHAANRFYAALYQLGETVAGLTQLVLTLDDLHWADPALWKSLEVFAQGLVSGGGILIVTYRRPGIENSLGWDVIQTWDRAGILKTITLMPLSIEEVAQIIAREHPKDPTAIHALTAGNPFYIQEWLAAREMKQSNPFTNMLNRLQNLSPTAHLAIESASILGETIPYRLWLEISRLSPLTLAGVTEELLLQHWLRPSSSGYSFAHDLIRITVYGMIEQDYRRQLHERAARAYQAFDPDNLRAQAFHLDKADLKSEAADIYIRVGEQELGRLANYEAASAFERALALMPPISTLKRTKTALSLGTACHIIGDPARQGPALREAMAGARKLEIPSLLLQVLLATAQAAIRANQNAKAEELLTEALSLATQIADPIGQAETMLLLGTNATNLMHSGVARRYYLKALNLAGKTADLSRQAKALRGLGIAARDLGMPRESIKWLDKALVIHRQIGDRIGEIVTQSNMITAYFDLASWDTVLAISDEVLPQAVGYKFRRLVAYVQQVKALACLSLGDFATARDLFAQAERDFMAGGDLRGASLARDSLGLVAENEGDYIEAERLYSTALAAIQMVEDASETYMIQLDLGSLLLRMERPLDAIPLLEAACQGSSIEGNQLGRLKSEATLGLALLAVNEWKQTETIADSGWEAFQKGVPIGEQPQGWLWVLYQLLMEIDRRDSAQTILNAAYSELQRQASAISDEDLRRSFYERVPLNRWIVEAYDSINGIPRVISVELAHIQAPLGRQLRNDEHVSVQWTVSAPEDDTIGDKAARRQYQLKRLLKEAESQNAAPTDNDLAQILGVSRRTILRDMQVLAQEILRLPTRKRKNEEFD